MCESAGAIKRRQQSLRALFCAKPYETAEDKSRTRSIAAYRANIDRVKAKGDAYSAKVEAGKARLQRFMETAER